ncbi:uncharacterized protein SSYIS1_18150 [Serratia symbiotica]|uniref:Uncharacterized protein n=1 Tax=Serratia symbiotica TaxID=138074 RepID=A0A455VKY7_9GAMM|nr:uncharacterized protein SSYIS1_18150 [Serratia symbiotica]
MHLQNQVPGLASCQIQPRHNDTPRACFFMSQFSYISMVGWMGEPQGSPVGCTGKANSVQFTTQD